MPGPGDLQLRPNPVPVVTSAYTAAPGDYVPVDTSGGTVTVTLPHAPAAGASVTVVLVAGANPVVVSSAGSDLLLRYGGPTSQAVTVAGESATWLYDNGIWHANSSGAPVSVTDDRYGALTWPTIRPSDCGVAAWTAAPVLGTTYFSPPAAGVVNMWLFRSYHGGPASDIYYACVGGTGLSGCYFGVYDTTASGNLIAYTSDQSAQLEVSGSYQAALSPTLTFTAGTLYRVALLVAAATTEPQLFSAGGQNSSTFSNLGSTSPEYYGAARYGTGLATLPASIPPSSLAVLPGYPVLVFK